MIRKSQPGFVKMKSCKTNLIFLSGNTISLVDNRETAHNFSWVFDSALLKLITDSLGKDRTGDIL